MNLIDHIDWLSASGGGIFLAVHLVCFAILVISIVEIGASPRKAGLKAFLVLFSFTALATFHLTIESVFTNQLEERVAEYKSLIEAKFGEGSCSYSPLAKNYYWWSNKDEVGFSIYKYNELEDVRIVEISGAYRLEKDDEDRSRRHILAKIILPLPARGEPATTEVLAELSKWLDQTSLSNNQ